MKIREVVFERFLYDAEEQDSAFVGSLSVERKATLGSIAREGERYTNF